MNDLQSIFTVSYSILYGIMLNGCLTLGLYFWGWLGETEPEKICNCTKLKILLRIFISFILINLIPFSFFACIYVKLSPYTSACFSQVFGIFLLSLFVFLPYRVLHVIIYCFKDYLYGRELFYHHDLRERIDKIRTVRGHLWGVLFYSIITVIGWQLIAG